jgi:hypothetical protein
VVVISYNYWKNKLGTSSTSMTIQSDRRIVTDRAVHYMRVSPGFFPTLGIQLVAGRDFDEHDLRDDLEQAFVPYWDRQSGGGTLYVKVRGKPQAAFAPIRAAVAQVDPAVPVVDMITLNDQIDQSLTTERMLATLSSGFGAIALLLSAVGLYGVIS